MKKRLLAGLLSLCLMLSMVPATALALDDGTETEPVATDTTSNSATSQDDTQDSSMENDSTETGTGDENTEETETTTGDENTAETETTTDSENTAEAETTTDSETAAEETMVAEVGDAQYATLEKAIAAAQDDQTVTLLCNAEYANFSITEAKTIIIELNGFTLTKTNGVTDKVQNGANLTIQNGVMVVNQMEAATATVLDVYENSSIVLDAVTLTTNGTALGADGQDATLWVRNNSTITAQGYCVATNAGTPDNYGNIKLEDSTINGSDGAHDVGTAICYNIPGLLTIERCKVQGYLQGVMVHGGTAIIKDSTITNMMEDDSLSNYFDSANWGSGNMVNVAALTLGNKYEGAYQYPTNVKLINTTITSAGSAANAYPAIYAWANKAEENGVTISYDNCTINGKIVYGDDGRNINATVENGIAQIDDTQYLTLVDAIAAAESGDTVTLLRDYTGGGIGTYRNPGTDANGNPQIAVKDFVLDLNGHTYTVDSPAVGSKGYESQAFHLEKGVAVTLKNGTITSTGSLVKMLIQNYCDLTLDNVVLDGTNLPANQYTLSNNCGNVQIKDSTILTPTGGCAFDLYYWPSNGYSEGVSVTVTGNSVIDGRVEYGSDESKNDVSTKTILTIKGGCFNGGFRTYGLGNNTANISISGGYFTSDPTAYLADDYAAVASDKDGYVYQVVKATNPPAEVVPEDPKVENKLPENASEDDKKLAASVLEELKELVVDEDIVKAAAGTVASQNTVTVDEGSNALQSAGIAESSNVTIVVQPYLDVTLTNATSGEQKNFTVDITPMYRTVATTDADNIVVFGESTGTEAANAVVIGSPTELAIDKAVEVTIQLPTDFTVAKTLYVHHQKDGVTYVYEGTVANNTLTFTNPHGFSLFTITSAAPQAEIDGVHYATLQDAVNAVSNGQTITLLANGSATVSREVTFMIIADGNFTADITAGSGYKLTRDGNTYTITEKSNSGGGVSHPTWDGSSSSSDRYDIDKPSNVDNGSIKVSPSSRAEAGDTVTITVTPDEGYELDELVVYDADGDEVDLDDEGDGAYTFEMPKSDVEIEVSFARISDADDETPVAAFVDVADSDWYADAVQYVFANGLMAGTSDTTFSPNATTTRAMIVTILYRLEGTPAVTGTTAFTDVAAGQYYADAVAWAAQNGIVSGTSATTFSPDGVITREQMAAILYRYAQYKGYDVTAKADLSMFTDATQVSTYATDAMAWANASGLISGTSATTLSPAGSATRAQVATILMRFCENIAK